MGVVRPRRPLMAGVAALALATLPLTTAWTPLTRAADGPAPATSPQQADQQWLVDAEGKQYRLHRVGKKEPHVRLAGNRLRLVYGRVVEIASEDAESFMVKIYREVPVALGPPVPRGVSAEEKARIAKTYEVDLKPSRTLSFEAFDEGLPRAGQWRYGFVLADMNGDGHLDIVHGPPRRSPGPPLIFLGDGAGRWRRWQTTFPGQPYDYGNVAVADFNGDGHLDIAMGMHLLGVSVLLGDGKGRFTDASQGMDALSPRTAFSSHALAAVDWDGDGRIDLVALGEGPRLGARRGGAPELSTSGGLVLYRNRGDGTWEKKSGAGAFAGDMIALARSRPEGKPWLVAGSITREQKDLVLRPGSPFTVETLPGVRPGATVRAVALADFDGDGQEDIAVAYIAYEGEQWRSGIDLVLRRADGSTERRSVLVEDGFLGVTAIGAGDLDGDGRPDLVALTANGETVVLRNAGGGVFTREDVQLTERITGCRGYHVEVQDLDKDGRADIVAGFAGEPEGIALYRTPGCPEEGSLRAWRSRPRS